MLSNNLPFENPCITFEPITHKVARISPGPLKGNHPKVWKSYRSYPQNPCIENNFCHNSNAKGNVGKGSPVTPHSPSTESDTWANGFIGPPKRNKLSTFTFSLTTQEKILNFGGLLVDCMNLTSGRGNEEWHNISWSIKKD